MPYQTVGDLRLEFPGATNAKNYRRELELDTAITSVSYKAPDLDLFMAATGVHYRGRVDLAQGRIQGSVLAPNGGVTPMDLTWVDTVTLPGYLPRPAMGGEIHSLVKHQSEKGDAYGEKNDLTLFHWRPACGCGCGRAQASPHPRMGSLASAPSTSDSPAP